MNAIIKNSEQLLIIENQLANKKDEIAKKTIALQNATTIAQARAGKERSGTNFSIQTQIQLQEELNKLNSESNKLIGQKQNLELSNIDLEQNVSNLGGIAELVVPKNTGEKINEKLEEVKPLIGKGISNLNEFIKEQPVSILGSGLTQLEADALIFKERLLMFQQDVANMLGQASEMGFNSFGESIGGALSNGTSVLKAAGASLLGTLGDIMVKYGQLAIAFGLASEAVASVFKNPFGGGVAAIIGGTALVAIGSAIKGFSSNVSSGGSGGATTSNAGSSSSSGGSSFSSGGSGLSSGSQNVVFQIQGTKLVGVLSNTLAQNRALGGNLSII
jgi:hypothetical protein